MNIESTDMGGKRERREDTRHSPAMFMADANSAKLSVENPIDLSSGRRLHTLLTRISFPSPDLWIRRNVLIVFPCYIDKNIKANS
ncbi:hypothetical protein F2Q69_00018793 [Brassica cretica]|uniref:Uncharacterized protein n=4 Tax=Brassica cretica TaxID=69181 RepID=A0A8S9QDU8_BRACR|nr:hypothetical protein F2Q69_00018793 [Brassica cretica]